MDANVGDLVVCVDAKPRSYTDPTSQTILREGYIYRVASLRQSGVGTNYVLDISPPGAMGWLNDRFRKIDHDKPESCETEFVTLLKRSPVSA